MQAKQCGSVSDGSTASQCGRQKRGSRTPACTSLARLNLVLSRIEASSPEVYDFSPPPLTPVRKQCPFASSDPVAARPHAHLHLQHLILFISTPSERIHHAYKQICAFLFPLAATEQGKILRLRLPPLRRETEQTLHRVCKFVPTAHSQYCRPCASYPPAYLRCAGSPQAT